MSKPPTWSVKLSDTLTLCEYPKESGHCGLWLHDKVQGMNLSMRAKTEREAFVEALTYYQERLTKIEDEHYQLRQKVNAFIETVAPPED